MVFPVHGGGVGGGTKGSVRNSAEQRESVYIVFVLSRIRAFARWVPQKVKRAGEFVLRKPS